MKKKIVIFSSTGGGGHVSASHALTTYLKDTYDIKVIYPFIEILSSIDIFRPLTLHKSHCEGFYNFITKKHFFTLLNIIYYIGKHYIRLRTNTICKLFKHFLIQEQPDLIISVMPHLNSEILTVAQTLNIPFLIIPTDLDAKTFIEGIRNLNYHKFHMGIAFNLPALWKTLEPIASIDSDYFSVIGFPLRAGFFKTYDKHVIKQEFGIPNDKKIILFMTGAAGSPTSLTFLNAIKKVTYPCHIIICLGRSESLKKSIERISLPHHISVTLFGFTHRIPELMAVADLFVTKSGTVSVCEAIFMNLPILIDARGTTLPWEKFNHTLIQKQGFGEIIYTNHQITQKINMLLKNPTTLDKFRTNLTHFKKTEFNKHIKILVHYMMSRKFIQRVLKLRYNFLKKKK